MSHQRRTYPKAVVVLVAKGSTDADDHGAHGVQLIVPHHVTIDEVDSLVASLRESIKELGNYLVMYDHGNTLICFVLLAGNPEEYPEALQDCHVAARVASDVRAKLDSQQPMQSAEPPRHGTLTAVMFRGLLDGGGRW